MGMGEKPRNTKTKIRKKSPVWLPSYPSVFKMPTADCFPVPENTENKPDLPNKKRLAV